MIRDTEFQAAADDIVRRLRAVSSTEIETMYSLTREAAADIYCLAARLAAAERDAARYRWLAENCADEADANMRTDDPPVLVWCSPYSKTWRTELDATIDAALERQP